MAEQPEHTALDESLFEALFKQHFGVLCRYAEQFTGDFDSAQEITQKVFINLWERRAQIRPEQSVVAYLYAAVKSRCLNHIRDHKKYRSRVLDLEILEDQAGSDFDDTDFEALQQRVAAALNTLPEKCREVFEKSRFQHKKYREIAEELDISVKTVEAHMSKALKTLKELLKDHLPSWWLLLIVLFL